MVIIMIITLFFRGVGCIFVEMFNGYPCFPGVRDVYDQVINANYLS